MSSRPHLQPHEDRAVRNWLRAKHALATSAGESGESGSVARGLLALRDVDAFLEEVMCEHLPFEAALEEMPPRTDEETRAALRVWAEGKKQRAEEVTVAKAADVHELEAFVNEVMHDENLPPAPEDSKSPAVPDPLFHTHPAEMVRWRQLLLKMQNGTATHADNIEAEKLSALLFPEEHAQSLTRGAHDPRPGAEPAPEPEPSVTERAAPTAVTAGSLATQQKAQQDSVSAALGEEIQMMDIDSRRELLRVVQNARALATRNHSQRLMTEYLRGLGKHDNEVYDVISSEFDDAKTFDLVMFRGTDFVSNAITKISRNRGSDFFSHVGLVLKPPLVPHGGHYWKHGRSIDRTGELGNFPFVQLNLSVETHGSNKGSNPWHGWRRGGSDGCNRTLHAVVLKCKRLPNRRDDIGVQDCPYVRLVLEPYGDVNAAVPPNESMVDDDPSADANSPVRETLAQARTRVGRSRTADGSLRLASESVYKDGLQRGNPVQTAVVWNTGANPTFNSSMCLPIPRVARGAGRARARKPLRLRVEVWDHDNNGPDDLVAEGYVNLESKFLMGALSTPAGKDMWVRLEVAESSNCSGARQLAVRNRVHMPRKLGPISVQRDEQRQHQKADARPVDWKPWSESDGRGIDREEFHMQGELLMAPLGRQYAALYKEEMPHLGCKTRCYRSLFTWQYFCFLAMIIAAMIANYVLLFVQYDKLFSDTSFDFTGLQAMYIDISSFVGLAGENNATALTNSTNSGLRTRCDDHMSEADCLYYFRMTFYIQVADWFFTAVYLFDLVLRLYCLKFAEWVQVKYHYLDLALVSLDAGFIALQYEGTHVKYAQVLRSVRLLRIVTLYTMYHRIQVYRTRQWRLRTVTVNHDSDGTVQISWDHRHSGEDRRTRGPFVIDHRIDPRNFDAARQQFVPAATASPAKPLSRGEHIKHLLHQSEHCFVIPVIDPRNSKRRLYLAFDACKADVQDGWIQGINKVYQNVAKANHMVRPEDHLIHHMKFVEMFMSPQTISTDYTHSYRELMHRDQLAAEAADQLRGDRPKELFAHVLAEISSSLPRITLTSTSDGARAEFSLQENDVYGKKIPYLWESAVSGRIAGVYRTSRVMDEETGRGALGVQVRNLREAIEDYDGEVCLLRFHATWEGEKVDFDDPIEQEWLQREITRIHELYYLRAYTCNCFLCLATLMPQCQGCAKWVSTLCTTICCGNKYLRSDAVKCSQLVANIYQAVGFMDPAIDPSEILPIDFLPKGLREADESTGDGGAGTLLKDVAAAQREASVRAQHSAP